jgi:hypothetical protein
LIQAPSRISPVEIHHRELPALHEDPMVTALCHNENSKNKLVFTVYAVSIQHDMPAKGFTLVGVHTVWADANWKGAPGPEESRYLGSVSTTVHSTVIGQLAKPRGAKSVAKKPGGETKSGEVFAGVAPGRTLRRYAM